MFNPTGNRNISLNKGENLEFEKLGYFFNLLDFQLLSQQVLSRVVAIIWLIHSAV